MKYPLAFICNITFFITPPPGEQKFHRNPTIKDKFCQILQINLFRSAKKAVRLPNQR